MGTNLDIHTSSGFLYFILQTKSLGEGLGEHVSEGLGGGLSTVEVVVDFCTCDYIQWGNIIPLLYTLISLQLYAIHDYYYIV